MIAVRRLQLIDRRTIRRLGTLRASLDFGGWQIAAHTFFHVAQAKLKSKSAENERQKVQTTVMGIFFEIFFVSFKSIYLFK